MKPTRPIAVAEKSILGYRDFRYQKLVLNLFDLEPESGEDEHLDLELDLDQVED